MQIDADAGMKMNSEGYEEETPHLPITEKKKRSKERKKTVKYYREKNQNRKPMKPPHRTMCVLHFHPDQRK